MRRKSLLISDGVSSGKTSREIGGWDSGRGEMQAWDGSLVKSVISGNQCWLRLVSHQLEWSHTADWTASSHCASGVGDGGQSG